MFESLLNAFRAPDIRRRILYVLGLLIVFRLLASVPVPGIDKEQLANFVGDNPLFGLLDLFSGGGLASFSVVALGMNPYINSSIIMQLMTGVVPSLQALSREGEYGRNKINQYTRYLTVPMAVLQAYGFLALLNYNGVLTSGFDLASFETLTQIATLTAGAIALMWIGELITERGIGNGISFIIFAGIVSRAPGALAGFIAAPNLAAFVAFGAVAIAAVGVIIYIQEGQRRIPIQYASRVRGSADVPGRADVPAAARQPGRRHPDHLRGEHPALPAAAGVVLHGLGDRHRHEHRDLAVVNLFTPNSPLYIVVYFLLTMGFTYFYTAFTFKPDETAEQLRKNGGFIPGIRPGRPTQDYLARVVTRITFAGALFLAIVAVSPSIIAFLFPDLATLGLGRHQPADRRVGRRRDA